MASSNEYANQETEMQGVSDDDDGTIYENIEDTQNKLYKKGKVRGKKSWLKRVFAIVCLIIAIAIASATTVMFIEVMYKEKTLQKNLSMPQPLSANLSVHETNWEEKLHKKLNEAEERFNNTIDSSISKLRNWEEKLHKKLNEAEARFNNTIDSSISKLRSDLEQLISVASCDQTSINGLYTLSSGRRVYCSDGWTVFQRRMDGSIPDFHTKTWDQYREGFGTLTEEFWLGLRKLHEITQQGGCRLRVDLQSWDNDKAYAEYSQFAVADEENFFRLSVEGYSGTAGDSLTMNNDLSSLYNINGMAFSTNERDNDNQGWMNCATYVNSGGWWNNGCFGASLNGLYQKPPFRNYGIRWQTWKGSTAIKFTQMGVRCD